jgi:tetratricopeptide (TPR) repeat protein
MESKSPNRTNSGMMRARSQQRSLVGLRSAAGLLLAVSLLAGACRYSSESALQRASDAWDSGDYEQAAEMYEHYLERYPDGATSLGARFKLANIYYINLHRYDRAAGHYREFLNQAPGDPDARVVRERLAEALSELGRSYEAIAEYENIPPQDETERRRIRLRIADIYFDQKNYSQALTEYSKITDGAAYDEFSEGAYLREASIYQLERKQYQQALPIYQKLYTETADSRVRRRALYNISDCHANLFQFDEAIKALREITDPSEQEYISRKIKDLEDRSREAERSMAAGKGLMR